MACGLRCLGVSEPHQRITLANVQEQQVLDKRF